MKRPHAVRKKKLKEKIPQFCEHTIVYGRKDYGRCYNKPKYFANSAYYQAKYICGVHARTMNYTSSDYIVSEL